MKRARVFVIPVRSEKCGVGSLGVFSFKKAGAFSVPFRVLKKKVTGDYVLF